MINARLFLWPLFSAVLLSAPGVSTADYVGADRCAQCHEAKTRAWRGSHHDLAMTESSEQTVLGDFNDAEITAHGVTSRFYRKDGGFYVRTDGPDGALHDYPIRYTFGWYPLQQYLIEFPRGHVQSLGLAWDTRAKEEGGQRWFHLYPDEAAMDHRHALHWTSREQTWNYQCAECHSTNLRKNYDLVADSYATRWSEIDVACESCHGPGAAHVAWADAAAQDPARKAEAGKGLVVDPADRDGGNWVIDSESGKPRRSKPRDSHTEIELCARCHSRRGQIWADYEYGEPLNNTHRLALLEEHLYFPDGQIKDEVYVYGSFLQSRMYAAGVTCSDCHEPHSLKLRAEGNQVCARCHLPDRYDTPAHHHHESGTEGATCSACHMPQRRYMVIDERADHSLRVPRPDLSETLGTPNACNQCHADQTPTWAAQAVQRWYPDSSHRGPHFGAALHAAATHAPEAADRLLALAGDTAQPGIARATALERLRERARPEHLLTVQRLLADDDALVRAAAVRWLEQTDVRTQVDQGWTHLEDPARAVRLEATRVLAPLSRQTLPDQFRSQLDQAVSEYIVAQRVNAERPEAHLNLGLIYTAQGKPLQAEEAYRTALRLDKAFVPGYANLADLYRQYQRDDEAEKVLGQGIAAVPDAAALHYALGLLQVRRDDMAGAVKSLDRATALAPGSTQYRYVYALALQRDGKVSAAVEELEDVLQRDPAHRDARLALVGIYREQGKREQALEHIRFLRKHDPEDPVVEELLREMQ